MIGGIGEMLRFQAKARAVTVKLATLPANRTVEEISAVELDTRFCC